MQHTVTALLIANASSLKSLTAAEWIKGLDSIQATKARLLKQD